MKIAHAVVLLVATVFIWGCSTGGNKQFTNVDTEYKKMLEAQKQRKNAQAADEVPAKMAELKPEDHERLGDRHVVEGNNVKALFQYARALELKPADINLRYKIGRVLLRQHLPVDALQQFEEIVRRE